LLIQQYRLGQHGGILCFFYCYATLKALKEEEEKGFNISKNVKKVVPWLGLSMIAVVCLLSIDDRTDDTSSVVEDDNPYSEDHNCNCAMYFRKIFKKKVETMEFSEFELQLDKLCRENGTITYFGSDLANIEYQEITNEIAIQDYLIDLYQVVIDESTITYADACLDHSILLRTKLRYYLFLVNNLKNKKKFERANAFVDYFFEHTEELSQMENKDDNLLEHCINTLLEVCVRMKLRVDDIWDYIFHFLTCNPHCGYYHAIKTVPLLTSEEREEKIRDLISQQLSLDAETGNYIPIENFLEDTNNLRGFIIGRELVLRRLAEAYMRRIEVAENSPIIGITFSQKAASIYKQLRDNELENNCLSALGKFMEMESPEWHESVIEFSPEENATINENIKIIQEVFSDIEITIQERISLLSRFITIGSKVIYTPCAVTSTIEDIAKNFDGSVFMQFGSVVTLDQDKVVANGNNSLLKAKELAYSLHNETTIIPAISALETSHEDSTDKIIESIESCPLVTDDEMNFITSAFEDYERGRWISFICVITPSFESILRELYYTLEGTHIQAKNKDTLVHSAVNLTTILNNSRVKEVLSDDITNYLEYLLNSETSSENIRNNVAHRLTPSNFYSQRRSRLLAHALILVSERIKNKLSEVDLTSKAENE
jgi:Domain of unknown function (DUF4209)